MKTLILVRHAKSSWAEPGQADFERPLNDRGKMNAPEMGQRLAARKIPLQLIVSSPAKRAKKTAKLMAAEIRYPEEQIMYEMDIYEASLEELLAVLRNVEDRYQHLMMVGHNPGLSYLVNYLSKTSVNHMPTCAMAYLHLNIDSWKQVKQSCASLADFDFPKRDPNDPD